MGSYALLLDTFAGSLRTQMEKFSDPTKVSLPNKILIKKTMFKYKLIFFFFKLEDLEENIDFVMWRDNKGMSRTWRD